MRLLSIMRIAAAVTIGTLTCSAAAILDIQLTNNSSPSFVADDAIRAREFRTEAFTPSSGMQVGDSVSFTNRFAWMSTQRVFPGPSGLPLTHGNLVAYDISFTVEDPAMIGYTLSIDSVFRGYVTALWEGIARPSIELVFAAGTLMGASINDGSGFGPLLNDISTDTEVAIATSSNPFVNLLVAKTGTHDMGSYVGTRTFTVRYGSVGANTSAALQNYNIGEVNVRFGLDPTYANFLNAGYPGVDGESSDTHGHFVTITADFENDVNPVPEPSTLSLMAVACALTCAWKRYRSAH